MAHPHPLRRSSSALLALLGAALSLTLPAGAGQREGPLGPGSMSGGPASPSPSPEPLTEEQLLREAFRYLKLTRAQMSRMLPYARYAEDSHQALQREEAATEKALEGPAGKDPAKVARLTQALEQRRQRLGEELVGGVAPQLARILTREQIALAWRLDQGNPPKYSAAHPGLLTPEAGFSQAAPDRRGLILEGTEPLGSGATPLDDPERTPTEAERLRAQMIDEYIRAQLGRQGLGRGTNEEGQGARVRNVRYSKPFPQLVVETSDLRDLLPALEPLARRLYFSDRLIPALEAGIAKGLGVGTQRLAAGPLRLVRDYRMERGFRDVTGRGPELEPMGGTVDHGLYVFGPGQGLQLSDAGVTNHYALQMNFRFAGGENYQKLVDFKGGTDDIGLYTYQGHLTFYTLANGGAAQPGKEHRLRLERDRSTRIVRCYLDLRQIFAFIDLDDAAVFNERKGQLFVDDRQTRGEQGAGALRSAAIWGPA